MFAESSSFNADRPSTISELRRSAELYYFERDARSNARVRMEVEPAPVSLVVSDASARNPNGQMMVLTLLNILLRTGRRFNAPAVDIPDVPLVVPVARLKARTLRQAAQELAERIDPHHAMYDGSRDFGVRVCIGDVAGLQQRTVGIGVTESGLGIAKEGFECATTPNPIAACIASSAAVAEIYKHCVPSGRRVEPVFATTIELPFSPGLNLGEILLVGAGGIGHAFSWLAQWLAVSGRITVLDSDEIGASNLNRYLLAFLEDVGQSKPDFLADAVRASSSLQATAVAGWYEDVRDRDEVDVADYDVVLTATDTGISRMEVQSDLPKLVCNAGTNAWSFEASRHNFSSGACVACLFPPRPGITYRAPVRCDGQGLEAVIPNDSYSFVTGLAGAFLALQLQSCRVASDVHPHISGSGLQIDSVMMGRREKDPECVLYCSHSAVQKRFQLKHSIKDAPNSLRGVSDAVPCDL